MSSARRPLLTATAAGTLLCALWFVPSANATGDEPAREAPSASPATQITQQARATTADTSDDVELADTGSFDTTPYVVGGTFSLVLGAGFVVYSVRRERHDF
ncbi:LPXTG cell wall anchor domain-containing protein [Streptomyces sp. GXMU-J15]|uniref:LPXTG cell wall anchor domain-containing protein n=1 Tax=Streptomyces fuscus TaxID=3048495 RepID=A0ABT7IYL5_9ACTN|nr:MULTISPECIES: LPXTG cell wall anchor domain-containing protein [Streptomyces]MDL2077216.1 LPXTG cell wall anchor domain-containing protein [Streptomyces fuscus]SBT95339.1 LPXTG-motif cell wall anchor domain-containing protein [Streptomyces sp. DI166]